MLIRKRKAWRIPEREAASEAVYLGRRSFIGALGAGGTYALGAGLISGLAGVTSLFSLDTAEGGIAKGSGGGGSVGQGPYPAPKNLSALSNSL